MSDKHIAGGHCVACDKGLSDIEQLTIGKHSGIELCLCRTCSTFVNGFGGQYVEWKDDGDIAALLEAFTRE